MSGRRRRAGGGPTLDEVAALAGVGRGTVSRVINGSPQVSPAARAAVEQAIRQLGYVPNRAARALVTRRTDAVALVMSESRERMFGGPFFAGIVRGVSAGLRGTPLQLWLMMAQSPPERERLGFSLNHQQVDGVLLLSLHGDDPLPRLVAERGVPLVLGGRPVGPVASDGATQSVWFVDVDHELGAQQAVEHLIATGRRRIATIAGPADTGAGLARLAGWQRACALAGLPAPDDLVVHGDFGEASGAAGMRQLLARRPDLDAVFAASDLMAAGALRVLREAGRRVPEDVAVVGFEDSTLARQTEPPLTTVHQPVEEMGRQMAALLVARIQGEHSDPGQVVLPTHLVVRQSA